MSEVNGNEVQFNDQALDRIAEEMRKGDGMWDTLDEPDTSTSGAVEQNAEAEALVSEVAERDRQIGELNQELNFARDQAQELMQRVASSERYERAAWRRLSDLTEAVTRAQADPS